MKNRRDIRGLVLWGIVAIIALAASLGALVLVLSFLADVLRVFAGH